MSIKIHWHFRYVNEGVFLPDEFNRWMVEGKIKIPTYGLEPYEDREWLFATVARITMKGTANADFVADPDLPTFNVKVMNVLERGSLFNTGWGNTSHFSDDFEECKKFAQRVIDFNYKMLKRADEYEQN